MTTKESGIVAIIIVDDASPAARTISEDVLDWAINTPRPTMNVTGQDKLAMERLLLLADASVVLNGVFDDGSNLAHITFKEVGDTSVIRTVSIAVSGQTLAMEMFQTDYALSRAQTGELTWSVPFELGDGTVPAWS